MSEKKSVEKTVREILHKNRKKYTAEEKIRSRAGRAAWGEHDCGIVPSRRHPPQHVSQVEW